MQFTDLKRPRIAITARFLTSICLYAIMVLPAKKRRQKEPTLSIFELVRANISPRTAAEFYGLNVDRSNRACCPFHPDRHPSMKLNDDYFYCFTCHESGDVTKLTAQLLGLSQYEAAQKLTTDFQLNIESNAAEQRPLPLRSKHLKERDALKELSCLLVHLKSIKLESAPLNPDEDFDKRFIQACLMTESVQYLVDILSFGMADDRAYALDRYAHEPIIQQARQLVAQYIWEGGFSLERSSESR